jgi:DNA invertase Pin-like site-specific DNA recombinase
MKIGYARISTQDQNLALQHSELLKAGCEKIYDDTSTGSRANRVGLNTVLDVLRKGDTLIVWKLDRLGRSLKHLIEIITILTTKEVNFKSITDNIDTSTTSGRFFFHVMGSLAEMERELIIERTKAGLKIAKERGRVGGRKRKMTDSKLTAAKKLLANGLLPKDVAKDLGVSVPTLYRWIPSAARFDDSTKE